MMKVCSEKNATKKVKKDKRKLVIILVIGLSALSLILVELFGLNMAPGDEMTFGLIGFYLVMPLTAFIASLVLTLKRTIVVIPVAVVFGVAGMVMPASIFRNFDWVGLFFAAVPAIVGIIVGLIVNLAKLKRMKA